MTRDKSQLKEALQEYTCDVKGFKITKADERAIERVVRQAKETKALRDMPAISTALN